MKTVLFAGIAATALLCTTSAADASDSLAVRTAADPLGIAWNSGHAPGGGHGSPEYDPAIRTDAQAYEWGDDGNVAFAAPDGSRYSYDGEWQGEFVDQQARVFEGEWQGTVTRHDGAYGPGHPAPIHHTGAPYREPDNTYDDDRYEVPRGYENYERCLKSSGLKGAAIGALLGGFAGNRIAGRGDRLGGTLVGAGLGGILGVAVEKASDKCKHHRPGDYRPPVAYRQHYQHQQSYGWQGGYYYYPPQIMTVTIIPGATMTTTTVTEEVTYETVRSAPRKRVIRKWKPKPRCVCR